MIPDNMNNDNNNVFMIWYFVRVKVDTRFFLYNYC